MATVSPGLEQPSTSLRPSHNGVVQMPDEAIEYTFSHSLLPSIDVWTPLAELQSKQMLARQRVQALAPTLMTLRGQVTAEREIAEPRPEQLPLLPGFIDLPIKLLESFRRKGDASEVGRALSVAARLREEVDRVVIL